MDNSIGKKIKAARKEKNITQMELAEKLKTKHPVVVSWETGRYNPSPDSIEKLSKALSKPTQYFTADSIPEPRLTYIPGFKEIPDTDLIEIPVLARIHAGEAGYSDTDVMYHTLISKKILPQAKMAVMVRGDCMSPKIEPGDILILKPQTEKINGKIVVSDTEKGHSIKRLKLIKDEWWLCCDNENGDPEHAPFRPKKLIVRWQVITVQKKEENL